MNSTAIRAAIIETVKKKQGAPAWVINSMVSSEINVPKISCNGQLKSLIHLGFLRSEERTDDFGTPYNAVFTTQKIWTPPKRSSELREVQMRFITNPNPQTPLPCSNESSGFYQIEKGHQPNATKTPDSKVRKLIELIKPMTKDESFLVPDAKAANLIRIQVYNSGLRLITRRQDNGTYRIWKKQ